MIFIKILYSLVLVWSWVLLLKYRRVIRSWTWTFMWAEKYIWNWWTYIVIMLMWLALIFVWVLYPFWGLDFIFDRK